MSHKHPFCRSFALSNMLLASACALPGESRNRDASAVVESATLGTAGDFTIDVDRTVRVPLGGLVELDVRKLGHFYDAPVTIDIAADVPGLVVVPGVVSRLYEIGAVRLGAQAPLTVGSTFTLRMVARAGAIERTADVHATVVNRAGALDPAFGDHGTAIARGSKYSDDAFRQGMVLPDGSIVGVGRYSMIADLLGRVVHWSADGSPNPRWPYAFVKPFKGIELFAVGQQSNGRLIVAGARRRKVLLAAIRSDGEMDPAFGDGGSEILDLPGDSGAFALRIAPDDRLVVAGYHNRRALVARFLSDGAPDYASAQHIFPEFEFREDVASQAHDLALDSDGSALVVGEAGYRAFLSRVRLTDIGGQAGDDALLPMPDGVEIAAAQKIAIQPDGRILIAGSVQRDGVSAVAVWRLLSGDRLHHVLDPSFGDCGATVIPVPGSFRPLAGFALLPDGRMVIAANANMNAKPDDVDHEQARPVLVRLRVDGTLDPGAGPAGTVPVGLGRGNVLSAITDAGEGELLLGFRWRQGAPNGGHFAGVARVWD